MRIATPLALCLLAGAAYAQGGPFLFDVLWKPSYRASWEKLMKEVQPTPDWLVEFSQSFNGVAGPMKPATIEGKNYELYFVCKPHDCAARKFEVMFEAATKRAYGALGGASDAPAFYGAPNPAMQEALAKALKG
jgi:Inhibitor of vertebrate lysozyme (Ivy)